MSLPGTRVTQPLTIAFALLGPSAAHAQAIKTELPDSLDKQATVPEGTAREAAMAKVPKGTLKAVQKGGKMRHPQDAGVSQGHQPDGIPAKHVEGVTGPG